MKLRTQVFIKSSTGEVIKGLLSFFLRFHSYSCFANTRVLDSARWLLNARYRIFARGVWILYASTVRLFALRVLRLFDHVIKIDMFRISTSYLRHLQLVISSGIYRTIPFTPLYYCKIELFYTPTIAMVRKKLWYKNNNWYNKKLLNKFVNVLLFEIINSY